MEKYIYLIHEHAIITENQFIADAENAGEYSGILALQEAIDAKCARRVRYPISKAITADIVKALTNTLYDDFINHRTYKEEYKQTIAFLLKNAIDMKAKQARPFTCEEVKDVYGLHMTLKHSGKMSGMFSLSTSCKINPFCRARIEHADEIAERLGMQAQDLICFNCFADDQTDSYGESFLKPFLFNTYLLTNFVLPIEVLPIINAYAFRFESFGDLVNMTQEINYFNLCKANKRVHFTQWTKNAGIIARTLEKHARPKNIKFIYSELKVNSTRTLADVKKVFPFFDSIFRVFTKDYAKDNNITINCGARHCLSCMLCYTFNDITEINEILRKKGDA